MIVVSNTSPLTSLTAIGQFNLLQALFGEIHVPVEEVLKNAGKLMPEVLRRL